jgi:proline iminopeptidase
MTALLALPSIEASAQGSVEREGYVVAEDGIRLHYRIEGSGAQTVIVPAELYLHRDLRALATERRMVFYDMRNRGRSDRVEDTTHITIEWDVRDLESVRRHVGAERFVPVGFSYLGLMVMLYAAEHPQRVERIIQIGPVARRWNTEFPRELTANDPRPVIDSAARAELERLERSELAERDPAAHCQRQYEITRVSLVGDPRLADRVPDVCHLPNELPRAFARHLRYHFLSSVQHLDVPWETFARITVPVLTVHGTRDRNAPYGAGREWVSRLPNARLLTVPGAAHMPWLDQPRLVLGAIESFLKGSWPAEAR